jgi:hypothetical protein
VILNEADSARVAKLIKARYGILGRLMMLTTAFRRNSASVGLEITPL